MINVEYCDKQSHLKGGHYLICKIKSMWHDTCINIHVNMVKPHGR